MTEWNEDNFLENITPLLGRRVGTALCSEASALSAVAGGQASEIVKKAIAVHTLGCPTCTDLQRRLERFDDPALAGDDAEWRQTEKWVGNTIQARGVRDEH